MTLPEWDNVEANDEVVLEKKKSSGATVIVKFKVHYVARTNTMLYADNTESYSPREWRLIEHTPGLRSEPEGDTVALFTNTKVLPHVYQRDTQGHWWKLTSEMVTSRRSVPWDDIARLEKSGWTITEVKR